jgi:hypothetical protein
LFPPIPVRRKRGDGGKPALLELSAAILKKVPAEFSNAAIRRAGCDGGIGGAVDRQECLTHV